MNLILSEYFESHKKAKTTFVFNIEAVLMMLAY